MTERVLAGEFGALGPQAYRYSPSFKPVLAALAAASGYNLVLYE